MVSGVLASKRLGALVLAAATACACATSSESDGPSSGGGGMVIVGSGGSSIVVPDSGQDDAGFYIDESLLTNAKLVISSSAATIAVSGQPAELALSVAYDNGTKPTNVVWVVDDTRIGSIGADGVFRANGLVGGKVIVTVSVGAQTATFEIDVTVTLQDLPSDVTATDADKLRAGGAAGADAAFRFVYPYDRTVFPRGIDAPRLQFGGTPADVTYLKMTSNGFTYEGFARPLDPTKPTRITIPPEVWRGATYSTTATDLIVVNVSKMSGTVVAGPVRQTWIVAQGTLKGIVYYNTYQSALAAQPRTGAVMRIRPGGIAEIMQLGQTNCMVCHSVSAQGNVLATGIDWAAPDPVDSATFDLSADGTATLRNKTSDGSTFAFAALSPDGKIAVTHGVPSSSPIVRGIEATRPSVVVDTATATVIAAPSYTDAVKFALTPAFAPDGKLLAFSNRDSSAKGEITTMAVDLSQSPPAFSDMTARYSSTGLVSGWPTTTPDNKAILFQEGDRYENEQYGGVVPVHAQVHLIDLADNSINPLSSLNGYDDKGVLYLPYGVAQEDSMSYEPNVLPVTVGGYYWVMFTSRRAYGNFIAPGGTVAGGDDIWGSGEDKPSIRKKIWLAAIDLDFHGKADPSHPAIYVSGQEMEAGNMRAFAALAPCKPRDASCESGADCCEGFCRETGRQADGTPVLQCVPPPPNACANVDEVCGTAADCCPHDPAYLCINGRCAIPAAPEPPPPPR